jgi:uncharacterized repeat protein (TIGR02543 family)
VADGATNVPETQIVPWMDNFVVDFETVIMKTPKKTGYTFLGWSTKEDFEDGDSSTVTYPYPVNPDKDYVIKLPFNYSFRESCTYGSSEDSSSGGAYFYTHRVPFTSASLEQREVKWDYCALERDLYKQAAAAGWSDYFAEIDKVEEINIFPTYIQKKAEYFKENYRNKKDTEMLQNFCFDKRVRFAAPEWYTDVYYSLNKNMDKFDAFTTFLKERGIDEDLHKKNVGYDIKTGHPLIVDYGGFREYD